jgi:hypothetical protein
MGLVNIDPNAPHDEDCGFWHGGACVCKPEMRDALEREHCHECDLLHGSGYNRCNCLGKCICDREEGCPCVGRLPAPVEAIR